MGILQILRANWRLIAILGLGLAVITTLAVQRGKIEQLSTKLEAAETRTALEAAAAARERANVDRLNEILQEERDKFAMERRARQYAEDALDAAEAASEQRAEDLKDAFDTERAEDETLDRCLSLELPDSILRQLAL